MGGAALKHVTTSREAVPGPSSDLLRRVLLAGTAVLLFALTYSYRFASMSGALGGFEDDEFVTLAYAQQMVLGDLPVRDFAENGSPLMHAISAGAIRWIGPPLLAEAVVTMGMLAICVVILFLLAERASGSIPIAATVAVLCIAIAPRFYNYPKLLVYAIALPAVWAYIDQPRRSRLLLMAAAGVIAFLLRHDYGAYVAVAAILAVAVARWPDARRSFRECAVLGVMALALVSPYLLYVQWHDGAYAYLQAFTSFARRAQSETNWKPVPFNLDWRLPLIMRVTPAPDRPSVNVRWVSGLTDDTREAAERELGLARNEYLRETTWKYELNDSSTAHLRSIVTDRRVADTQGIDRIAFVLNDPESTSPPSLGERVLAHLQSIHVLPGILHAANAVPFLYYTMLAVPIVAVVVVALGMSPTDAIGWKNAGPKIVVTSVLALLMIYGLLRGNLTSRFGDVTEVVGVLAAWVFAVVVRRQSRGARLGAVAISIVMVVLTAASVETIEHVTAQISQTRITSGIAAARGQWRDVHRMLSGVPPIERLDAEAGTVALARYLRECTAPSDRVLTMAYVPQLTVLAGRGFAGGVPWFLPEYFGDEATQQRMVPRLHDHRVPIAVTVTEPDFSEDYVTSFPLLAAVLKAEYRDLGVIDFDHGARYNVLVRSDLTPTRSYGPRALPCFAG